MVGFGPESARLDGLGEDEAHGEERHGDAETEGEARSEDVPGDGGG